MIKEQTTIRLPEELKEKLMKEAQKMGISFNAIVIMFLFRCLESG